MLIFASLLLNLVPGLVTGIPGISTKIKALVGDVAGATSALLASGAAQAPSVNTILAAWAGILSVLRSDPNLPQDKLGMVDELQKVVAAALIEDQQALLGVNWSKFLLPTANV